ncbi:MAG: hypothetical protein ACP5J4_03490 [Anaerolineae bacterium]
MVTTAKQIANTFGLSEPDLFQQAVLSFLREKKRQILQARLDILTRYNVETYTALEAKIASGAVSEHPAWEDCITAENLTARLEELNVYLADLQDAAN